MPHERSDKRTTGPIASAPCPWCKKANDFREIHEAKMLEKGSAFECDHCKEVMEVVAVRTMPQVIFKQQGAADAEGES